MSAFRMTFVAESRRRRSSLITLTLLTALAVGVVLTAFAAARRTESVPDRFFAEARGSDGTVELHGDDVDVADVADEIDTLPSVEDAGRGAFMGAVLPSLESFVPLLGPVDGKLGVDFERGLLVDGRRPDPDAVHEIAISENAAEILGVGVGDELNYDGLTPAEFDMCLAGESDPPPECEALFGRTDGPIPITLDVVGIVRTGTDVTGIANDFAVITVTPGFYEHYHGRIGEEANLVPVRLREDATPEQFARELDAIRPDSVEVIYEFNSGRSFSNATDTMAFWLTVFALVVLIAAAFVVGQAVLRQLQVTAGQLATLSALGMTRRSRAVLSALPVLPAAIAGCMLGAGGAWLASQWFPRGIASRGEPDPGIDFDAVVLLEGTLLLAAMMFALTAVGAWRKTRSPRDRHARAPRPMLRSVYALQPPPIGIGVGLATDAGHGARAVPVRSAFVACIAATAGVVAVLGFGAALERLQETPELYGSPFDAAGFRDPGPLLEDPDVDAVAAVTFRAPLRVDGRPVYAFAYESLRGDLGPTVVRGRAPETVDEVALGADTMKRAGVEVGDTVQVSGPGEAREMRVVGTSVFPVIDNSNELADGVVVLPEAIRTLDATDDEMFDSYVIRVDTTADRDAVIERLAASESDLGGGVVAAVPPGEIENLDEIDSYPTWLAAVLALLGIAGLAHALALSARRRAPDLALLRALGFLRRDVRSSIVWQSLTIASVGVVAGIPLGLLIGRASWALIADNVGVRVEHVLPVAALLATVPIVVLVALAAAWLPARRAARLRPAELLRNE